MAVKDLPYITITKEMLEEATRMCPKVAVNRTKASEIDTLTGILGEYVFAAYYYGDWKKNSVGKNKGNVDFEDVEVKTSAFPLNEKLNLLVREDYAKKRKPKYYVQIIIDVSDPRANNIELGTKAYLCGFASAKEVDGSPLKDFGSKYNKDGGYKCHYISIGNLRSMIEFEGTKHEN